MITHYDLDRLREYLKGKPSREDLDKIFGELKARVDYTPVSPDPEEVLIPVTCHIGPPLQMVSCCAATALLVKHGRMVYHIGEKKLKLKLIDSYLHITYCHHCGIKVNVKQ